MAKTNGTKGQKWTLKLQTLLAKPVKEPVKRDFDMERQKKEFEISKIRKEIKQINQDMDKWKQQKDAGYSQMKTKRENTVYKELRQAQEERQKHQSAVQSLLGQSRSQMDKLKNASRDLSRKYRSNDPSEIVKMLKSDIKGIRDQLERGTLGNRRQSAIQHEKDLMKQMKDLKKMLADAESLEEAFKVAKEKREKLQPDLAKTQEARNQASDHLGKLRDQKSSIENEITGIMDNVKNIQSLMSKCTAKRNECRERITTLEGEIDAIRKKFKKETDTYEKYIAEVRNVRQKSEQERRKLLMDEAKAREQEELEKLAEANSGPLEDDKQPLKEAKKPEPKPTGAAAGGDAPKPKPKKPRKPKKKAEEEDNVPKGLEVKTVFRPFLNEINNHKSLIKYLQRLKPEEKKSSAAAKKYKRFGGDNSDIANEWSLMGGSASKKKKKRNRKKQREDAELRHSLQIIRQFTALKVAFPKTLADVDASLEDLKGKLAEWEKRAECKKSGKEYVAPKAAEEETPAEEEKPTEKAEEVEKVEIPTHDLVESEEPVVSV